MSRYFKSNKGSSIFSTNNSNSHICWKNSLKKEDIVFENDYLGIDWAISLISRVFANGPGDWGSISG